MTLPAAPAPAPPARAALPILLFIVFLSMIGFGSVIPLLPFYGDLFEAPAWQVTLLFAGFALGQFFGELYWGRLSDRIGRRPVLMITLLLASLGFVGFAFAPNIWVAIAFRCLGGFFTGTMSTVQSYIADISPRDRLAQRLGLVGTVFGIGFVVGPIVGGLLSHPEDGAAGMRTPLLAAALLYLLAAIGVIFALKESRHAGAQNVAPVSQLAALRSAVSDPMVRRLMLITLVSFTAFSAVMPSVGLWGQGRFAWGPRDVGLVLAFSGGFGAFGQWIYYRTIGRKVGGLATIAGSLVFAGACLGLMALSPTTLVACLVISLGVTGHMVSQPATTALISSLSPPEQQGAVLGANMAAGALARVAGPVFAGAMISAFGLSGPFPTAALLMLPAVWLAVSAGGASKA